MTAAPQVPAVTDAAEQAGLPTKFEPKKARKRDAQADAVIDYAKKVRDWPMLGDAIDQKMEDQVEFVRWWEENVRPANRPKTVSAQKQLSVEQAEDLTGITKLQVHKWRRRLKEPEEYRSMLYGAAYAKAMAETSNTTATKWTGDPESYTPAKYIEAARTVMGGIDLDPASNMHAQKTVKATEWYDEGEDGLVQEWQGRVFLNPPYTHPLIAKFIEKLCAEIEAGKVTQAVLLTNNNTDTKWWHLAAQLAAGVCFTLGRINFYKADGTETQPTNGQTFFYFGDEDDKFSEVFAEHGLIMVRHAA